MTKGKVLCKVSDDPVLSYELSGTRFQESKDGAERACYVLVFQENPVLKERVLRICDSYASSAGVKAGESAVTRYQLPRNGQGTQTEYRDEIVRK